MKTKIVVRYVTPADFARWLPLWESYNEFYGRSGKTALPSEITETTWNRFFDDHEPVYAMKLYDKVAERSGFLIYRKQLP